jgi:hypothetical protein
MLSLREGILSGDSIRDSRFEGLTLYYNFKQLDRKPNCHYSRKRLSGEFPAWKSASADGSERRLVTANKSRWHTPSNACRKPYQTSHGRCRE